jgi:transposase
MNKRFLEDCLAEGLSLDQIGQRVGKHPSTVSYWLGKHRLKPNGRDRHAPTGAIDPERLAELASNGASIRAIAAEFGAGYSTVRYWLKRLSLETERTKRMAETAEARRLGLKRIYLRCSKHGHTAFFSRPDGGYRCTKCNQEGVSEWRRSVKRRLIEKAGGGCTICGYDRFPGALHFHHLDPAEKEFMLSRQGVTRSFAEACAEADKCVLLCANCHAEVEGGFTELTNNPDKVVAA